MSDISASTTLLRSILQVRHEIVEFKFVRYSHLFLLLNISGHLKAFAFLLRKSGLHSVTDLAIEII